MRSISTRLVKPAVDHREDVYVAGPNDDIQSFLYRIHRHDYENFCDDEEDDDDNDSVAEGDDFMHEFMVNGTRANFARYGVKMPEDRRWQL